MDDVAAAGAATVFVAAADELVVAATVAVGFLESKENIPLPTTAAAGLLSAVLLFAAEPKLNEGLAEEANLLELVVVVVAALPAADSEPKLTIGFFCSITLLLLLVVVVGVVGVASAGLANVKATLLGASAGLLLDDEEPKLNPVVVVEDTASVDLAVSDVAGLDPKLKPLDPNVVDVGLDASVFSTVLGLSVTSEVAVDLPPKLKAPVEAVVLAVLVPLPKLNFGLSSEVVVLVVDVTVPKLNPELTAVDVLVVELAGGTPNENPVLGASLLSVL